ncbi:MAG: hypothetical protein LBG06_02185 [Deltaproteobacteria bacterium]|jgi:hypothetical protein|nr:hypothetical protein [Deltaproteobacteria bacterium]
MTSAPSGNLARNSASSADTSASSRSILAFPAARPSISPFSLEFSAWSSSISRFSRELRASARALAAARAAGSVSCTGIAGLAWRMYANRRIMVTKKSRDMRSLTEARYP